jgi:hypothetical protein
MNNNKIIGRRTSDGNTPQVNFRNAEFDRINSTYVMEMFCDQKEHPITFYSKKMNFREADDKIYVLISMIERFVVRENCFLRPFEEKNGRIYSPANMLEFWKHAGVERNLVLRLYHPKKSNPICYFDLNLKNNEFINLRLAKIYELLLNGQIADLDFSKPRRLVKDEMVDFHFTSFQSLQDWLNHLGNLYLKYPEKGKIDNYKLVYESIHFAKKEQKASIIPIQCVPHQWLNFLQIAKSNLTESQYSFFESLEFVSFEGDTLKVKALNKGHYKIIEENYLPQLRKAIDESFGQNVNLEYEIRN